MLDEHNEHAQLKEAVLGGDVDRVRALLGPRSVPLTFPPLLGLACRYVGADMARFLAARSEASLSLLRGPFSWRTDPRDYGAYLFPAADVPEDAEYEPVSDDERTRVIRALVQTREEDRDALLFDAALYADEKLIDLLEAQGVYFHPEKARLLPSSDAVEREVVSSIQRAVDGADPSRAARILALTRRLLGIPIPFQNWFFCSPRGYGGYCPTAPLDARFCDPELFPALCEHTNLLKTLTRKQVFRGLAAAHNEAAVRKLIETKYFTGGERLEQFVRIIQEEFPQEMGIQTLLMNRLGQIRSRRRSADLSLDQDPLSRRALAATWTWTDLKDGSVRINNYKGNEVDVAVPERVGRKPVSRLGAFAFSPEAKVAVKNREERDRIRSVHIPDGIRLGYGVFCACQSLESVRLPEDLEEIPPVAFARAPSLLTLQIPESVRIIGSGAFFGCGVRELRLPDSLRELGPEAFERSMLRKISLPARAFSARKVESCRENRKMPKLLPVGHGAFRMCAALMSVEFRGDGWILPSSLFEHCHALSDATIPAGVETVGAEAFAGCAIRRADFPASVSRVGDRAFLGAFALSEVAFEGENVLLGRSVFEDCALLSDVKLPSAQREIPARTFKGCADLKSILVPSSVEEIGKEAFSKTGVSIRSLRR